MTNPEALVPTQADIDALKEIFGFTDDILDVSGADARTLQILARHRLAHQPAPVEYDVLREYLSLHPGNRKLYAEIKVAEGAFADVHAFYEAVVAAMLSEWGNSCPTGAESA